MSQNTKRITKVNNDFTIWLDILFALMRYWEILSYLMWCCVCYIKYKNKIRYKNVHFLLIGLKMLDKYN